MEGMAVLVNVILFIVITGFLIERSVVFRAKKVSSMELHRLKSANLIGWVSLRLSLLVTFIISITTKD
tara:strand:+ start:3790 stop:3993 length:204 start_codon:yes stop_codon:yes gene_type:complete